MVIRGQAPFRYKPGDASTVHGSGGSDSQLTKIMDQVSQLTETVSAVQRDQRNFRDQMERTYLSANSGSGGRMPSIQKQEPNFECRTNEQCKTTEVCADGDCVPKTEYYSRLQRDALASRRPSAADDSDHHPSKYPTRGSHKSNNNNNNNNVMQRQGQERQVQSTNDEAINSIKNGGATVSFSDIAAGACYWLFYICLMVFDLVVLTKLVTSLDGRACLQVASLKRWVQRQMEGKTRKRPFITVWGHVLVYDNTHAERLTDIYFYKVLIALLLLVVSRLPWMLFQDSGFLFLLTGMGYMCRALCLLMFAITDDTGGIAIKSPELSVSRQNSVRSPQSDEYNQNSYTNEHYVPEKSDTFESVRMGGSPRAAHAPPARRMMPAQSPSPNPHPDFGLAPDRVPMPAIRRKSRPEHEYSNQ